MKELIVEEIKVVFGVDLRVKLEETLGENTYVKG